VIHCEQIKTNLIENGRKMRKLLMILITLAGQYNNKVAAAELRLTGKWRYVPGVKTGNP